MALPKSLKQMQRQAAPPIRPSNLVTKMRRIRWELALAKDRTRDAAVADELGRLVRQTDDTIDRIKAKHQEKFE